MTIRPRGSKRRKGRGAVRTRADEFVPPLVYRPVPVKRQGIVRKGVGRASPAPRPLSDRQLALAALLDERPRGATELGRAVGISCSQAASALHVLANRGLADWSPGKGWTSPGADGGR
jgi:hypothetical protein